MKAKSLQFGKAMSAALFVLLLVVVGMTNALAQNQIATLQHEGNITMFYGVNAFQNANNAAQNGDTITLSSGSFRGCTLSKAVTIHGAGCVEDTVASVLPTALIDDIYLDNHNDTLSLTIDGINGSEVKFYYKNNCKNVVVNKCNIRALYPYGSTYSTYIYNSSFGNCIIKQFWYNGSGSVIVNCVVGGVGFSQNNSTVYNSIIELGDGTFTNSMVINSIISSSGYNTIGNSICYNCIGITSYLNGNSSLFEGQVNNTNMIANSYSDVFETFAGEITFNNSYQLKEEIANSFLGNDGTEVGVYGGLKPYNPRPSYMIIRRCNVAGRTTEDNKLSVEIELNTND